MFCWIDDLCFIFFSFLKTPWSQNWRFVAFSANISIETDLYASALLKVEKINSVTTYKNNRQIVRIHLSILLAANVLRV